MKLKMKTTATLLIAIFMISTFAFTVIASDTGDIVLGSTYSGIAEWTTETKAVGDYSVKLVWPAPYWDAESNYIVPRAYVVINIPEGMTINDITSWSYWVNAPEDYAPCLTFYVDTEAENDEGKDYDTTISAWPKNDDLGDIWIQIDEATIGGYKGAYVIWGSNPWPSWEFSWTEVVSEYGSATIMRVQMGKGVIGTNQDIIAYVDDFEMNEVIYELEPPTKADIVPGKGQGIETAPGLDKPLPNDNFAKGRE